MTDHHDPLMVRGLAEAARLTGLGERTIWRLTKLNALPHRRCGRAFLFVLDELEAWVNSGCPTDAGAADRVRAAMRKGAPMTPTERLLGALRDHGYEPKRSGSQWTCRCPAHDDRRPSLSIGTGHDGRALANCHAGCDTADVVAAIGLTMSDLMPNLVNETPRRRPESGVSLTLTQMTHAKDDSVFRTANEAIRSYGLGKPSETWTYANADGSAVGVVARWDIEDGKKEIRPVSLNGLGWIRGGMPEPRPLYNLQALADADRIYVVEGEKVADAAIACGLVATTSAHGADSAAKTDWSPVADAELVMLVDHDEAGERYGQVVVELSCKAGARHVRVIRLVNRFPDLPVHGDLVDALELAHGDVDAIRIAIEELTDAAEPIESEQPDRKDHGPVFDLGKLFPDSCSQFADYLAAVARSTQTPEEMCAMLALAVISAAVSNVATIRGFGDHIEPAQLWMLVLSPPGSRKTAVFAELMAAILRWEQQQSDIMGPLVAEAEQRRRLAEKRLQNLERDAAKQVDPTERRSIETDAVELALELAASPTPTVPMLLASEPTPEGLSQQMAANHGRALLASAEADTFDIVLGRYSKSANFGIFLKGHAGDAVRSPRSGRPGDVIDHPALAVALTCQVAAVQEIWSDPQAKGRGLLARFMVAAPADRIGSRDVRPLPVPPALRTHWNDGIERLLAFEVPERPTEFVLSPAADAIYHMFQLRTEHELGFGELADRQAWGGKLCGAALRIALTLHALGTWGVRGTVAEAGPISVETMRAAIAWADYLADAERHARGEIGLTDEEREQRRLIRWIRGKGRSVTPSELQSGDRRYRKPGMAEAALDALVVAGYGRWVHPPPAPKGGRPSKRFELTVAASVKETPTDMPRSGGFVDAPGDEWGEVA